MSIALASVLAMGCGGREGHPSDAIAGSGNTTTNVSSGAAQVSGSFAVEPSGSATSVAASGGEAGPASLRDAGAADATDDETEAFEASMDGGAGSSDLDAASSDAGADSSAALAAPKLAPVAPSASRFAWQSLRPTFYSMEHRARVALPCP